jgi:hypothetical protein
LVSRPKDLAPLLHRSSHQSLQFRIEAVHAAELSVSHSANGTDQLVFFTFDLLYLISRIAPSRRFIACANADRFSVWIAP